MSAPPPVELTLPAIKSRWPRAAFCTPALPLRPLTKLAAIEGSANVRQWLFPGRISAVQVPRQFHGVVQYPPDHEQGGLEAVNQEVARPADYLRSCTHVIAA